MSRLRQPLFKLALGSIKAHLWINVKLCLVFSVLAILVCLFTSFNLAIDNKRKDIFEQSASSNYMYGSEDKTEYLQQNGMPNFEHSEIGRYNLSAYLKEQVGADVPTVTVQYLALTVNGRKHTFVSQDDPDLLWMYRLSHDPTQDETYPFTEQDYSELRLRYGDVKLYVGEMPTKGYEALVSQRLLDQFGIKAEEVYNEQTKQGSKVFIEVVGDDSYIHEITVTGIISREYYGLSGHSDGKTQIVPTVIFAAHNSLPIHEDNVDALHVYSFDTWTDFGADQLNALVKKGKLVYGGLQNYYNRATLSKISTVVVNMYAVIGSIIASALLLTVMLMIGKFVNIFARTGGILLGFGLQQRNLRTLLYVQIMLMFAMSLPLALVGALVGDAVIVQLIAIGTQMTMTVSTSSLLTLLALSVATVFVVTTVFFAFAWLRLRNKSVRQLLMSQTD